MIDRAAIARLIPHDGAMCLLDRVTRWDESGITCTAISHRDPANPLANRNELPALCGIEYAAQAMAVHGALTGAIDARPRVGYLAAVREVEALVARLDDLAGDLTIKAERIMGDGDQVIYRFALSAAERTLLSGRATVILQ